MSPSLNVNGLGNIYLYHGIKSRVQVGQGMLHGRNDDQSGTAATIKRKRAEFDASVAKVPADQLTMPTAQGDWSVKDIVAHISNYEGWMADRLHERLQGIDYVPVPLDMMHYDERNKIIYEQNKDRTLADVLAWSQATHKRLIEGIEAHAEAFLIEPQQLAGALEPVTIWKMLRSEVYDHYTEHIAFIEEFVRVH